MACGLAMMVMTRSLILSLEMARTAYYDEYRFGDVFCNLKRAPNALRERLSRIPGIAGLHTQVVGTLRMNLPGVREQVDGTIISIPKDRSLGLNGIFLRTGRFPEGGREVIISEPFALAHSLEPGDSVEVILRGAGNGWK
jgi:putative ABC transport system permease protein